MIRYNFLRILFLLMALHLCSCKKYLDEKSDKQLATPETVDDYQALMDAYRPVIAEFACSGEVSADDYMISDADYSNLDADADKRLYTWQPDYVAERGAFGNDWNKCYTAIYVSNAVLHDLEAKKIPGTDYIRGQALHWRAARYLDALQVWAPAYNSATAATDLGLPLRLDPDMNIPSKRATVQQTYDQVIKDLQEAIPLLRVREIGVGRPTKWAAYGLLARAYLFMGSYELALQQVLEGLGLNDGLMDFNNLNPGDAYPIKRTNIEIGFLATMRITDHLYSDRPKIAPAFYDTYDNNDLRKTLFFKTGIGGDIMFRGNYYDQRGIYISGVTTDEMYLMAAECYARQNEVAKAMDMLNKLLKTRWKAGTYSNLTAASKEKALEIILKERRKELLFRGLRWPDLKRLNRDGANITLSRTVEGQTYTLLPNDPRYAIAIPEDIIELTGMPQNKR